MRQSHFINAVVATVALSLGTLVPAQAGSTRTFAADGSLQYQYGGPGEPTLTCRPLFICDVALENGESVLNLAIGDSSRWILAPGQSGESAAIPHVFIKPTEANLSTNLVITTSKRVYYIRLVSSMKASMSRLSFAYPQDAALAKAKRLAAERQKQADEASQLPLYSPDRLDYSFRIDGAREIMPQRAYTDGVHTFLEYTALPTDLPVLYAVAPDGSDQIVNYRLRDNVFIIDGIQNGFDLVLNAGTGKHGRGELRATIRRK